VAWLAANRRRIGPANRPSHSERALCEEASGDPLEASDDPPEAGAGAGAAVAVVEGTGDEGVA
jgi:hypothetical protein